MAGVGGAINWVGKGFNGIIGKLFRVRIAYLFIIVLFIQAVSVGIHDGSGAIGIIESLGERFFNLAVNLHETSLDIINSGAVFDGYWELLLTIWALFSNLYLIYLWLKFFYWVFGKSFLSNESESFKNICFSLITFLFFQWGYLLFNPSEFTNKEIILIPFTAFYDFFRAVILLFSSTDFNKIVNNTENLNVCTDASGCIV